MRTRSVIAALAAIALTGPALTAQPDNAIWATNFSSGAGIRSISKIDLRGSVITSTTISASFTPFGLAVDQFGNVWSGSNGTSIAKLDRIGNVINTYPVGSFPQSVATDQNGDVWVANRSSNSVMKLDQNGNVLATTPLPAGSAPIGIIVDQNGIVWVSGFHSSGSTTHNLFRLDTTGTIINTFSFTAPTGFAFSFPSIDRDNDVWVANQGRSSLMQINVTGNIVSETPITMGLPRGNQIDGLNQVWLASQGFAGSCVKIDQTGAIVQTFLPPSTSFTTCSIDANGDPWVFGFSQAKAIKLWQVDATSLVEVPVPSGGSAWGGDTGAFHLAMNVQPAADFDNDTFNNLSEINAGTNFLDPMSTPLNPLPIQSGLPTIGGTIQIGFRSRGDANLQYVAGAALNIQPGIPLPDGRTIPLNFDDLLILSVFNPLGAVVFPGFMGTLDANGDARGQIQIPNLPSLSNFTFAVAFITIDPAAPSSIRTVSNPLIITIP